MCVPEITIRPDGRGFVVRKGGEEFNIYATEFGFEAFLNPKEGKPAIYQFDFVPIFGGGKTIMEAVEGALSQCDGNIQ